VEEREFLAQVVTKSVGNLTQNTQFRNRYLKPGPFRIQVISVAFLTNFLSEALSVAWRKTSTYYGVLF
jgi:hypothetical protein